MFLARENSDSLLVTGPRPGERGVEREREREREGTGADGSLLPTEASLKAYTHIHMCTTTAMVTSSLAN